MLEDDLIDDLRATFQRLSLEGAGPYVVSDSMFEFLDAHRRIVLLLMKAETGTSLRNKFYREVFPFFEAQLEYRYEITKGIPQEELRNIMHFVVSGYDYFFTRYLEDANLDYHAISSMCTELSTQAFLSWSRRAGH